MRRAACGKDGEKGERGDVLYVGPEEVAEAAKHLREQKSHIISTINELIQAREHYPEHFQQLLRNRLNRIRQALR